MNALLSLVALVWSLRIVANLLAYIQLWYVKEYRFDRMLIHLRTRQGKRLWFIRFRLPPFSPKTLVIALASLGVFSFVLFQLPLPLFIKLVVIDLGSFPLTVILVLLVGLPTRLYHAYLITKAVNKLRNHKPMVVIGITGSFGKTSTKEYLAAILSVRFQVLKTPASKNSPIGIAETVLAQLQPQHEIFVVEMGAYKRGEIAKMAGMVRPQIGIITAVNAQHQDLFGTLATTTRAKYELIQGLDGQGLGIFNADNVHVREMAGWARRAGRRVWCYSAQKPTSQVKAQRWFTAVNLTADLHALDCEVNDGKQQFKLRAQVVGEHQVSNVLAAVAAAVACGMKFSEAVTACGRIVPVEKVLQIMPGIKGATFIDDTFNNNPDAAKAALAVLAKTQGRKFLVFQPMIELGRFTAQAHAQVGREAGKICDAIILTNDNFSSDFLTGAKQAGGVDKVQILSRDNARHYLQNQLKTGDTVLFKGKEAEVVLKALVVKN